MGFTGKEKTTLPEDEDEFASSISNGPGIWNKTVIRRVFPVYGARIRLSCPEFRPNSTYKPTYTLRG
jgi:hypothetical protein